VKHKICRNCGDSLPNWVTIDGQKKNIQRRKFCLTCSPYKGGNRRTRVDISKEEGHTLNRSKPCQICKRPRNIDRGRRCSTCITLLRRHRAKKRAVALLGGRCIHCGLTATDRRLPAFAFHHRDPIEKIFALASNMHKSWDFIKPEIEKCDLLCTNCHNIHHSNQPDIFYEIL